MTPPHSRRTFTANGLGLVFCATTSACGLGSRATPRTAMSTSSTPESLWELLHPRDDARSVERDEQRARAAVAEHASVARLPSSPERPLSQRWATPLPEALLPDRVLAGPHGIVVAGRQQCMLTDTSGRITGRAPRASAALALSHDGRRLVTTSATAPTVPVVGLPEGDDIGALDFPSRRTLTGVQHWGDFFLLTAVARPRAHADELSQAWATLSFLPRLPLRDRKLVSSPLRNRTIATVFCEDSEIVLAAGNRAGVVLANEHGVQWTDWALRPTATWIRAQRPLAVATDPEGTAYLAAMVDGQPRLLVLDAQGRKRADIPLPDSARVPMSAPLVGPHGRVVLAPPGRVVAYDRDGNSPWEFSRTATSNPAALGGAAALVEHDGGLWVCAWDGQAHRVADLPEPLVAAPVEHDGIWYAASARALYALG